MSEAENRDEIIRRLDEANISLPARKTTLSKLGISELRTYVTDTDYGYGVNWVMSKKAGGVATLSPQDGRIALHCFAKELVLRGASVIVLGLLTVSKMLSQRDGEEALDSYMHLVISGFYRGGPCPLDPYKLTELREYIEHREMQWAPTHLMFETEGQTIAESKDWYGERFVEFLDEANSTVFVTIRR
jgi:hypothetical protein